MNQGKYVFSQVMDYFPHWFHEKAFGKYDGDFHAKNLNSYSHCPHLMICPLTGCRSLKDISLVLINETYFVTRAKTPMRYDIVKNNNTNDLAGIVGARVIHISGYISKKKYPKDLRLLKFDDAEKDASVVYCLN
ncbi:MAG: DUF4372 domain-containing protein [Bacteroidales bacterium]|nr:DUF4372 domain-containing protein [Bacteroidales bacterium]